MAQKTTEQDATVRFEEGYLIRSIGSIANTPDVALTELVANAWDAGASRVQILIPDDYDEWISVEDDGCGMSPQQFRLRWMTLGYNRAIRQGQDAEFPEDRNDWKRRAYGRNGVGRHGMHCFSDRYEVETWKDGVCSHFAITTSSGNEPFKLTSEDSSSKQGHGTKIRAVVAAHLPDADRIRDVLSARFLHDPRFEVEVNGVSVPLAEHPGVIDQEVLHPTDSVTLRVIFIDSTQRARTKQRQGIAFWVGGRLVGEPTWSLGDQLIVDGRTSFAKRYTVVVQSDDLFDDVYPDWSAFLKTAKIAQVHEAVGEYVQRIYSQVCADRIEETKKTVLREHRNELRELQPHARVEVSEFVEDLVGGHPTLQLEMVSTAVRALVKLEQSRGGKGLLKKLLSLSPEDIEGLDRLLSDWTVRDALEVLDEIDGRLSVIDAIEKLSGNPDVDELHTLHPLVAQARWLFGAEFDTPEYASNISLRNAVERVFGQRLAPGAFLNSRKRPDLVVLADATLSAVALERFTDDTALTTMQCVLLLELKRGGTTIGRVEMNQASDYVEDLLSCGLLDGPPFIRAFVVGHKLSGKLHPTRKIGDPADRGKIQGTTYGQLVRTAEKRLFGLRKRLSERYEEISESPLLSEILNEPEQLELAEAEQRPGDDCHDATPVEQRR